MIFAVFWENPAVVGIIIAIPATVLGYLGYRRSLGVDKAVESVGEMAGHIGLINALQADNLVLRGELTLLREGVELIQKRLDVVEDGSEVLQAKNRDLEREIVVLHMENEALRVENEKLTARISELENANH